jgi:hypothetical protein
VAVFLADAAIDWFETLNLRDITTWNQFEEMFTAKFGRNSNDRLSDVTGLMELKQAEGQTVEEFAVLVRKQAAIIGATQEEVYMIVINGLRTDLKCQIMMGEPTTLEDVLRRGRIVERYTLQPVKQKIENIYNISRISLRDGEIEEEQEDVRGRVRFKNLNIEGRKKSNETSDVRRREDRSTSPSTERRQRDWSNDRGNNWNRPPRFENRRDDYRMERGHGRGGYNQSRYDGNQQRRDYTNDRNRVSQNRGECLQCGHRHFGSRCPAYGTICRKCQKPNHLSKMCYGGNDQYNRREREGYNGSQQLPQ